jgi:Predicted naringenin-chalcone synthase
MSHAPRLAAIATASPVIEIDRRQAAELATRLFGADMERLGPIFANSGIERRRFCLPAQWYLHPHGWRERSLLFAGHALDLAAEASLRCLDRAGLRPDQVDAVVAVSTTGICTPSLDALLMERLGLRRDVTRLPVFGLGCAGGVLGLARAAALAQAKPGAKVLLAVVELCGLTFRPGDRSASNMIATALFGDGAACALVSTDIDGPALAAWGEHTWPDSLGVMGWRIEDDGPGVVFSRDIPSLVRGRFRAALDSWLAGHGLHRNDVGRFFCHPGGAKVVAALEESLDLRPGTLATERAVLREFGNMSAATVLYVLESGLASPLPAHSVATALGPGFTAGFLLLRP